MKIKRIEISHHRLELDPPFPAAWDSRPRRHFDATIVQVSTNEGLVGVGSGDVMVGFEGYEELFIDHDPMDIERHAAVLDNIQFHSGRCWPLDLALWDLIGKAKGEPCWRLLGGRSDRIKAYASTGSLSAPEQHADLAQQIFEAGFPAMKMRFGRASLADDIAALEAVRTRVGDQLELMVDCNQGWRMPWDTNDPWTVDQAMDIAAELEKLGVYWMEEPLHRADREGMARLREATTVRIAGGEMAREAHDLRDLISDGCLDVIQPDAALTGGITGLRKIAKMAEDAGVIFTPHTWTNGIGLVANAHLTAAMVDAPFLEYPFDPPGWTPERRDFMMSDPVTVEPDGALVLPDRPGFGFELDDDRLRATRLG